MNAAANLPALGKNQTEIAGAKKETAGEIAMQVNRNVNHGTSPIRGTNHQTSDIEQKPE